MINLTISGKVGNDAKELENGCVFSLATTKKGFTTRDGKDIPDKTTWFNVFGHKNLSPYIKKGDSVTIYTDDIGTQVYEGKAQLSCRAVSLEFGGKSNKGGNQQSSELPPQTSDDGDPLPF